jgi:hypothetical protein
MTVVIAILAIVCITVALVCRNLANDRNEREGRSRWTDIDG